LFRCLVSIFRRFRAYFGVYRIIPLRTFRRLDCQCEKESELQKGLEWGGGCCKCLLKKNLFLHKTSHSCVMLDRAQWRILFSFCVYAVMLLISQKDILNYLPYIVPRNALGFTGQSCGNWRFLLHDYSILFIIRQSYFVWRVLGSLWGREEFCVFIIDGSFPPPRAGLLLETTRLISKAIGAATFSCLKVQISGIDSSSRFSKLKSNFRLFRSHA